MSCEPRHVAIVLCVLALAFSAPNAVRGGQGIAALQDRIQAAEYEIAAHDDVLQAPNRAHGFLTRFEPDGVELVPQRRTDPSWTWGLAWVAYGSGSGAWSVPPADLSPEGARITYHRGALREWYDNGPGGLKQSFFLPHPPAEWAARSGAAPRDAAPQAPPDGSIYLELALAGDLSPAVSADGQAIVFRRAGERVLRYSDLLVTDAQDTRLSARMEAFVRAEARGIRIVIDAAEAVFPITVDPLTTEPWWSAESNQSTAFLGTSVATAGDVNGDGYSDVIVGAYSYTNGQTDEGRAYLFLGSATGLSPTPAWTAESDQAGAHFGRSVATAGDVNGDGYADVLVGAPNFANGQVQEGRAYLYLGSSTGLPSTPAWIAESDSTSAQLGYAVASAGDVNGDGYADVVIGAPTYTSGQQDEGGVFVFHGSASGLPATASWIGEADQAGAAFGWSVGTAGDVDGDGFSDVIVGAFLYQNGQADEGRVFVYHGSSSGLAASPAWTKENNDDWSHFGWSVATAGDVNGDGYADVIVGAPGYGSIQTENEGRAEVYLGSSTGLLPFVAWSYESNASSTSLGFSVASAGDIDGDGFAEVIVGAPLWDSPLRTNVGKAYLFGGSATGLSTVASWSGEGVQANSSYGASIATAGDVDGDGYADVVVGQPGYFAPSSNEGRALVYHGSRAGVPSVNALWFRDWTLPWLNVGVVEAAGDVNGDGYADFLIGIPSWSRAELYLGSAFGPSTTPAWTGSAEPPTDYARNLGAAGDVNGDGYSDVIVGDEEGGGRAYVYHGSTTGLAEDPSWVVDGSGSFGSSVSTAGDVNGDGYADVLVGAPFFSNGHSGEGRAALYLGSASGLSTVASWAQEGDQTGSSLGHFVSTAGDVNRDGYSDVLVSAFGQARLYLGSAAGLASTPAWSGGVASDAMTAAGDVNGDGYGDVAFGNPLFAGAFPNQGRASVYLGFAGGLSAAPAWTVDGVETNGLRGQDVSSGDVNGDGYSDILVGAMGEGIGGRAFGYLGSASGLSPTHDWVVESTFADVNFGWYVAMVGDVNGDGYAETLIASPNSDAIGPDAGWLDLYYGNRRRGIAMIPRPRSGDDSRPIARLGASDAPDALRLAANGRTAFGRGTVRLEAEVKPLGVPFDGLGTHLSSPADGAGTVQAVVSGLPSATPLHWRVRLRPDPATIPLAPAGRWMTMPWGGWSETMLRTASASPAGAGRAAALTLNKVGLGITAVWLGTGSCVSGDDHALYEGTLGNFTSHVPVTCSTDHFNSWNFTPQPGNRYFLLVPINGVHEGSYGLDGNQAERPASASACLPQLVAACP